MSPGHNNTPHATVPTTLLPPTRRTISTAPYSFLIHHVPTARLTFLHEDTQTAQNPLHTTLYGEDGALHTLSFSTSPWEVFRLLIFARPGHVSARKTKRERPAGYSTSTLPTSDIYLGASNNECYKIWEIIIEEYKDICLSTNADVDPADAQIISRSSQC